MNEVIKNILTRRSIRDFSDKPVSKEDIELLVKTGLYAPSGMNKQTWKFTAITNKEIIVELCQKIGNVLGRDDYDMYCPTALIIPSNDRESLWLKEDNACAMQNIFLAAHSMGIGSVWINQLSDISDNAQIREMLSKIQIPENHIIDGIVALGYSKSEPKGIVEKKSNYIIIE